MHIVLLGATGKTGTELLAQALDAGDKVTVVAREPNKIRVKNPNLTIITGDATDVNTLTKAMNGNQVLFSTLGSMKNASIITDSTKAIIAAAKSTGLKRVIMMSSFAVKREQLKGFSKLMTGIVLKKAISDKTTGEASLRASGLDWTIVYATVLNNNPLTGQTRVVPAPELLSMRDRIARSDVAAWMLNEARTNNYVKTDSIITSHR